MLIKGNRPGVGVSLPFHRKILYYGLMLGLTLLALEGMARLAYYAAYGQGYGDGPNAPMNPSTPPPPIITPRILPPPRL